jgi:preprotein translocase subunit SecD
MAADVPDPDDRAGSLYPRRSMVPSVRRHVLHLTLAIAIVAIPLLAVAATSTTPQLGLDLQGGTSVVLAPKAGVKVESDALGQAVKTSGTGSTPSGSPSRRSAGRATTSSSTSPA